MSQGWRKHPNCLPLFHNSVFPNLHHAVWERAAEYPVTPSSKLGREAGAQSPWFVPCSFSIPGRLCLAMQLSPLPAEGWNYLFKWKFDNNLEPSVWRQEESCHLSSLHQTQTSQCTSTHVQTAELWLCAGPTLGEHTERGDQLAAAKRLPRRWGLSGELGSDCQTRPEILSISHLSPEHRGTLTFLSLWQADHVGTFAPVV